MERLRREEWLALARDLDWTPSYVDEAELYPVAMSGRPWLKKDAWADWDEPYKTTFRGYVETQHKKEQAVVAVREALGRLRESGGRDPGWQSAVKLHAATLPLAEFAASIGNLRAARFARVGPWRTAALYGALDELRHTQIPLALMHELVRMDAQYDFAHRFYHSNNWVAIAARHAFDEMLLTSDAVEMAIATNFVFETGFTNLQFIGLSALSGEVGDHLFETMITSIQSDEARHAQIGPPVLETVVKHDRAYAQHLIDKWFWRSWLLFSVVTGFAMDYLTPLERRGPSFAEFVEEWILHQFLDSLDRLGLDRPWYWKIFERSLVNYHHMVYASAYSYRATVWFDLVMPGPPERAWLARKYPTSWEAYEPVWDRIAERWGATDPGVDFGVHGTAIPTFCHLCQMVLSHGTPSRNDAVSVEIRGKRRVFCSEPCRFIFEQEPSRYEGHKDVVERVLVGEAPGNLIAFLTEYSDLRHAIWGKDAHGGVYDWLLRTDKHPDDEGETP